MKTSYFYLIVLLLSFQTAFSQSVPQKINYQAVARDQNGTPMANTPIKLRFSIYEGNANGPLVFQETHLTNTNQMGLFSLHIGEGTPVSGSLATIQWGQQAHFLEV